MLSHNHTCEFLSGNGMILPAVFIIQGEHITSHIIFILWIKFFLLICCSHIFKLLFRHFNLINSLVFENRRAISRWIFNLFCITFASLSIGLGLRQTFSLWKCLKRVSMFLISFRKSSDGITRKCCLVC